LPASQSVSQPAAAVARNFHEKKHFNGGFPENDFGETREAAIKAPIHGRSHAAAAAAGCH